MLGNVIDATCSYLFLHSSVHEWLIKTRRVGSLADATASAPLGVSWSYVEQWTSGKGIRDATTDTVIGCLLTPTLASTYGLESYETEHSLDGLWDGSLGRLSDDQLSALCGELDVGANGRRMQLAALRAPVITTADVQRCHIMPRCHACRTSLVESLRGARVPESVWNNPIEAVGPATLFVSHVWSQSFDELLSALSEFMCTVPLDRRAEVSA